MQSIMDSLQNIAATLGALASIAFILLMFWFSWWAMNQEGMRADEEKDGQE